MTQPMQKNVCPACQHDNPPDAKQCENCKALLGTIGTIPVPEVALDAANNLKTRDISIYRGDFRAGALAIHIAGQPQPIIIKGQHDDIVLGRRVNDETPPTVDLSEYHAHLLGVSRHHAVIHKQNAQFTLEDLNSSNGTWLNENRLPPNQPQKLQHGDQIRLGQLIMFVYFTSIQAIKLVEQSEDATSLARRRITPRYVAERIGPYLLAIEQLQILIDEFQGRTPAEVGLGSLVVGAENSLTVTLENAVEAIHWTRTKIAPWRKQHADVIGRLRAAESVPPQPPPAAGEPKPTALLKPPQPLPDRQEFEAHLAKEFITQVAPLLPPEIGQTHVPKLVPLLHVLLFSTIEITNEV